MSLCHQSLFLSVMNGAVEHVGEYNIKAEALDAERSARVALTSVTYFDHETLGKR